MKIIITCVVEDTESEGADRLRPILAFTSTYAGDFKGRSHRASLAASRIKGAILCFFGQLAEPPDDIHFTTIDLTNIPKATA